MWGTELQIKLQNEGHDGTVRSYIGMEQEKEAHAVTLVGGASVLFSPES
jgi:hypothetical protein